MYRFFLDANIVIDYLDLASEDHLVAKKCLQIIRTHFGKPIVSPFTFLITNFLLGKLMKDKLKHKRQMTSVFSQMEITQVKSSDISTVLSGSFVDLEDGLQYQCALSAKANAIITKDVHDYFSSKIPVIHPLDFVTRYNNLFN